MGCIVGLALSITMALVAGATAQESADSNVLAGPAIPGVPGRIDLQGDSVSTPIGSAPARISTLAVPGAGPGYQLADSHLRDRASYVIRLVRTGQGDVETLRSAVQTAALNLSYGGGIQLTVAAGTIADAVPDRQPPNGEIYVAIDGSSPCGSGPIGCGTNTYSWQYGDTVYTVQHGRVWIYPNARANINSNGLGAAGMVSLVSHELGHAVGLAHFSDKYEGRYQVMYPQLGPSTFAPSYLRGDGNGLRALHPQSSGYFLTDRLASHTVSQFLFNGSAGTRLMCDWNNRKVDTPVVFVNGVWTVRFSLTTGAPDLTFKFGLAGDRPVCGDWDGNGTDSPGVKRGSQWYLSYGTHGGVNATFRWGPTTGLPLAGNWDGSADGKDGIGVVNGTTWSLTDRLNGTSNRASFGWGAAGGRPITGDWNGDGRTGIGQVNSSTWKLKDVPAGGAADYSFNFGRPTDVPLAGAWSAPSKKETVGVFRP